VKKTSNNTSFFKYFTLGFQILATVLLGVIIGQWLDRKFHVENNWFTIGFSLLMIIVAMIQVVRTILK